MKTSFFPILFTCCLLISQCQSADLPSDTRSTSAETSTSAAVQGGNAILPSPAQRTLVTRFWQAASADAQARSASQLLAAAPDVNTLYQWLKAGPEYSARVPVGQQELERTDLSGTTFPYVVLIPEDYNPERAYPVEFNLHGGVNRPRLAPGETLWRQGYDAMREPDRIVVLPAAWDDAFWWFENQAANVPAILKSIKQTYHVDDNRVTLSGVSDGGTGAYFFAFMQPTEWAAFLPYIGNPGVLRNPAAMVSHPLSFENLTGKPLYIVNGENDPLYPASGVQRYIDLMERAGVEYIYKVIPGGGHNTRWLPEERPQITQFKLDHPRDPLPDRLQWVTSRTDRYNRNHWIRLDTLRSEGQPGRLVVERQDNTLEITDYYVPRFTLLLSPDEIDFSRPVVVRVNGTVVHEGMVQQNPVTLLKWAAHDRDRSMLFTAELNLQIPPELASPGPAAPAGQSASARQ